MKRNQSGVLIMIGAEGKREVFYYHFLINKN